MKTILVTGCAGFIGSHFCSYVKELNADIQIVGIDNFFNSSKESVHSDIIFIEGNIQDRALLASLFETYTFDAVFHFAAIPQVEFCQEKPLEAFETNVKGTHCLLEQIAQMQAAKGFSPKMIFSSSAAVYGNTEKVPVEEMDPKCPAGFYGMHKLMCEGLIAQYVEHKKISAVSLRYFNVFGPGQRGDSPYATVIAKWFALLKEGKPLRIHGDGKQSRDFIYIDSIIDANLLAYAKGKAGDAYNIASGNAINLLQLKDLIQDILKEKRGEISVDFREPRLGDIRRSLASTEKATADLGFDGCGNLKEELEETAMWWGLV